MKLPDERFFMTKSGSQVTYYRILGSRGRSLCGPDVCDMAPADIKAAVRRAHARGEAYAIAVSAMCPQRRDALRYGPGCTAAAMIAAGIA